MKNMDRNFLEERMYVIGNYQKGRIKHQKDREYYLAYLNKITYKIMGLACINYKNATDLLPQYIEDFLRRESRQVKNGLFTRPKEMLYLACRDANDVVNSMRRWDGVEDVYNVEKIYGFKD
jgi:hypothetical protein